MVEHCCSLMKTTTQLYVLPHAKAKVKSCLLHQNMEFYNTDNNCNWKPKFWLDNFWPVICRIDFIGCWSGIVNSAPYDREDSWITIDWLSDIHSKHTISCDHCHCQSLIAHVALILSIKRFFIHMLASPLSDQWCHCFVDSLSPKLKYIYGLTLSQVNPRPQKEYITST